MPSKKTRQPDVANSPLIPHLLTLATQAADQMLELTLTMATHTSVDEALESQPPEDTVDILVSPSQLFVLRRALTTEMQLQLKALAHTTDALYHCTARLAGEQR